MPGWASTVLPIFLIGGMQLLALGVIGEYVAKIYIETKNRPRYLIDRMASRPETTHPGSPSTQSVKTTSLLPRKNNTL